MPRRTLVLVAALAAAHLPPLLHAQSVPRGAATARDTGLAGLWGIEASFGPIARGALTLARDGGGRWTARIAGFEAPARVAGDSVRATLPGGRGELRARRRAAGAAPVLAGYWVQPRTLSGGSAYATPVTLRRAAAGVWRGVVEPLEDRYSLYALIGRAADGSLSAIFRNPDRNSRGGAPRFRVERSGAAVKFVDPQSADVAIPATYDSAARTLTVTWPALGVPLVLTPRTRDDGVGFYPRVPAGGGAYAYRAPLPADDGWRTARAASVGMDERALAALVQRILDTDPTDRAAPLVHSVLLARRGRLVLEEYFYGYHRDRPHDLRSGSKTFASVLVGAAMLRGARLGPDTPVYPLFGRTAPGANPDPRKQRITLRHLMTMSSGLACDENDDDSPGNEETMQNQTAQPDWYAFALDLPVAHDPGSTYAYCSASVNLVGGAVRAATGAWLPEYFDRTVAEPLQVRHYHMFLTPTGEAYFGGGMRLRPRDYLKFGQAYLDGGRWNGRRIVSADWVAQSVAKQMESGDGGSDGFDWHRYQLTSGGRSYQEYEANGNGGQFVIVLPELDMVVAFTAGNYGQYPVWRKFRDELVPQVIIPAVTAR